MKENLDKLKIGSKFFNSRLMLGTGKYKTTNDTKQQTIQNSKNYKTANITKTAILQS